MPVWMISALTALRSIALGTPGRALTTGVGTGLSLPALDFSFLPGVGGPDDDKRKRRRRRRALTNSDRDDIAFIAATVSKAAAGSFATQLVTRSR